MGTVEPRVGLPDPDVGPPSLGRSATLGEVVAAAISGHVAHYLHHEPGVRLGHDPEDVHQARVALRRLRSDLRTFRSVLDTRRLGDIDAEVRALARALGAVRDADVLLDRVRAHVAALPEADRAGGAGLSARLDQDRAEARAAVLRALEDDGYVDLLDRLVAFAHDPPLTPSAGEPARTALPRLVRRPWKRLRRAVDSLRRDPPDHELHAVRIRAKRARYAAEAASPVLGRRTARLARRLGRLQDVLGTVQDTVATEARLRDLARDAAGPLAYVAGLVVAAERARRDDARRTWPGAWRAASDCANRLD